MKTYGTVSFGKKNWTINAEPHVLMRLRRIFARSSAKSGPIVMKHTEEVCRDIQWALERYPLEISDSDRLKLTASAKAYEERNEYFAKVVASGTERKFELAVPAREYQKVAADLALKMGGLLLGDMVGLGKEQPIDTKVLTPLGWKELGSLAVGDYVIGSNGEPTEVLGVYPQGIKPTYRVTFSDHSSVEAGDDHLWQVFYKRGSKYKSNLVLTTKQLRDRPTLVQEWLPNKSNKTKTKLNLAKTTLQVPFLLQPVEFSPLKEDLPIHPYVTGQLIANGYLANSTPQLTTKTEDWDQVKNLITEYIDIGFNREAPGCQQSNILDICPIIKDLNLKVLSQEKFIPEIYKLATPSERIDLLHGLMDADGTISETRNRVNYCTSSPQLAKDVQELVECLGGSSAVHAYDRTHENKGIDYQVKIRLPPSIKPFTLKRKADRYNIKSAREYPTRTVTYVEYTRDVDSMCIKVAAADHLYVTEHCILTHNTASAICTFTEPTTLPALVVCMTHLPDQWKREINRFAPNLSVHIGRKVTPDVPKDKHFDVYIISYSKLAGWADLMTGSVNSFIIDEGQELRRTGTAKYTAAAMIAAECKYKLILSATPIYNYGVEFFNVINIIRPDVLGTRAEFLHEWCTGFYHEDKARISDPKAFGTYVREQGIMLRRTRKDVGRELPALTQIEHFIECDEKALEAVQNSVTELAKFILSKQGNRLDRMQAGGRLDQQMRQATGISKASYAAEFIKMLASSGEKIVVYSYHHAVHDILADRLKEFKPVKYTGEESPKQKEDSKKAFCDGDSQILLMSINAGAGLDGLQFVSAIAVVVELSWSYGQIAQALGRLHRDGQESPVMAYFLLSDQGSDPIMLDVLGIKRGQLEFVIDPDITDIEEIAPVKDINKLAESILKQHGIEIPKPIEED